MKLPRFFAIGALVFSCWLADGFIAWARSPAGTLPADREGRPLNLDFEDGTLRDWTATGERFPGQPDQEGRSIKTGNLAEAASPGIKASFGSVVTRSSRTNRAARSLPRLSGRRNLGRHSALAAAICRGRASSWCAPIRARCSSPRAGGIRRRWRWKWSISGALKDREIFIRLVDEESGGWGHVNFDDFRFHAQKPSGPRLRKQHRSRTSIRCRRTRSNLPDFRRDEAVKAMTSAAGFQGHALRRRARREATRSPLPSMTADACGWRKRTRIRLRQPEGQGKDRIVVFEDQDGDGKFDRRTVFMEGLNLVSGIEARLRRRVGRRGAVSDVHPDRRWRRAEARGRTEDPARWLGLRRHARDAEHVRLGAGRLALRLPRRLHAQRGRASPARPTSERAKINAGIWRYHPTQHRFEVFAEGTSNPWGLDFNDHGHAIIEACVIPHLWHIIQGAHYQRQAGQHFNPHVYDDIKTIADHVHYAGRDAARRQQPQRRRGRRPRARRVDGLSRRKLAGEISRAGLHEQHPRRADQHGQSGAAGQRLRRANTARTSSSSTTRGRRS